MKIKISNFCSMSRNSDWLDFLKSIAPELYYELNDFLRAQKGCKSAKDKMVDIYRKIYAMGKGNEFESFVSIRFPYIIESNDKDGMRPPQNNRQTVARYIKPILSSKTSDESLNKHNVFKSYKPDMLTFPQKLIIVNSDPKLLIDTVRSFIADKVGVDYVIIEDRAYIEYFLPKYKDLIYKVPYQNREIARFKVKMMDGNNSIQSRAVERV